MMSLMTLQTACGHFIEKKIIGEILGKPVKDLQALDPDDLITPQSQTEWMTALVIAFIELNCSEERVLWQMSIV